MIIDAAWLDPKGKAYFTHHAKYYSDKDSKERSLPGMFTGLGFSSIDAALIGAGTRKGKIYFFSGELYTRFDFNTGKCEEGYPSSIKGVWNIPFSKIDAAWSHPAIKNKYYMSSGSEYIRLTVDKGGFDSGYPKPISQHWHGIKFSHIDAVIQGTGNRSGKLYFFSGTQYVRYDMQSDKVDRGYPNNIMGIWGVPDSWKPETRAHKVTVQLIKVVCKTTEDSGPFGSHDELRVVWGGFAGENKVIGIWQGDIDDGQTRFFPIDKGLVFNGTLSANDPVVFRVTLWDSDHGGGAEEYKRALEVALDAAQKGGALAGGTVGVVVTAIATAAKAIGLADVVADIVAGIDGDDFLGEARFEEPVKELPRGKSEHMMCFRESGADYKLYFQVEVS